MNWSEQDLEDAKQRMRVKTQGNGERGHGIRVTTHSVGDPSPTRSRFRSKLEEAWASKLDLELKAGLIFAWWYEPFSLWLPGRVRYKPDFLVQRRDPQYVVSIDCTTPYILELIEVKGWSKNRRDGITRMKVASAIFTCFKWILVSRTSEGGWNETHVG